MACFRIFYYASNAPKMKLLKPEYRMPSLFSVDVNAKSKKKAIKQIAKQRSTDPLFRIDHIREMS